MAWRSVLQSLVGFRRWWGIGSSGSKWESSVSCSSEMLVNKLSVLTVESEVVVSSVGAVKRVLSGS